RYIAFLTPLTACLLVPVLRYVARRKMALAVAMLVLALDVGRGALEAAQIFHPFYTSGIERRFFNLLDDPEHRKRPILVNAPVLRTASRGRASWLHRVGPDSYAVRGMPPPDPIAGARVAASRRFDLDGRVWSGAAN